MRCPGRARRVAPAVSVIAVRAPGMYRQTIRIVPPSAATPITATRFGSPVAAKTPALTTRLSLGTSGKSPSIIAKAHSAT